MTVYLIWSFTQHENERWKTASGQFCKLQICAFLILHTPVAAAEQNIWISFCKVSYFICFLSWNTSFSSHFPEYCEVHEHFELAYLPQKDDFLLVNKARVLCLDLCKTGSHSITYLLSMLDIQRMIWNSTSIQKYILCIFVIVVEHIFRLKIYRIKTQKTWI